jgi:c-di-GMP-binding flagellar brake protein YcgR
VTLLLRVLPPPLLQTRYQFLATPDTRSIWIFVGLAIGIVALFTVGSLLMRRRSRHLDPVQRRRYGRRMFRRTAKSLGLQKHHLALLEYLLRATKAVRPFQVFSSPAVLDDVLRKGIYALQQNHSLKEEDRQRRMSAIFQIKQIIERNTRRSGGIRSTTTLRTGQSVEMITEKGERHRSRVVSSMRDILAVAAPQGPDGMARRWPRGTRIRRSFWREGDAGYVFESKVLGYDTVKGTLCFLVHHAKTLRREQQRRFRRTDLNRPCFFYPIHVVSLEGRRGGRRAVVQENMRLLGNLLDISAGGCSINSAYPLKTGSLCKIEFELGRRQHMAVFGKVRAVGRQGTRGGIMHVMFTRMSTAYLNQIYLYVYNYAPPRTLPARAR